jgi:signal transduction histidine kinase
MGGSHLVLEVRARSTAGISDRARGAKRTSDTSDEAAIRALLAAQDDELRRIARDLHDVAGQALTGVKLILDGIRREPGRPSDAVLRQSIAEVDRAMREIRELAMDVRPAMLDDLGLAAAVRSQVARQARFGGFRTYVTTDELPDDLDPALAAACLRILQEALTNIVRHARATRVRVSVRYGLGRLVLAVEDDGIGIQVGDHAASGVARRTPRLGLIGMTERAAIVGGWLDVRPGRRHGTRVEAYFPVAVDKHDTASR